MENNKNIHNRFNKAARMAIVYSKAASVDSGLDCIYPESLAIAILMMGPKENTNPISDEVISLLSECNLNINKCKKDFRFILSKRKRVNNDAEKLEDPSIYEIKRSKQFAEICKSASKLSSKMNDDYIGIQHLFVSLLQNSKSVLSVFEKNGMNYSYVYKEIMESDHQDGDTKVSRKKQHASDKTDALHSFCVDLTMEAKNGSLDPIIAREKEIEQAITILCRRNKNNPILLGEPGVGKTAIVEGIAQKIQQNKVPRQLKNNKVFSLSLSSLVAGTKYRGEFEERIKRLVDEIQKTKNCILFIDEIHTLVGAGASGGGSLDASNILKPFLAKNGLKCIGATTLQEFKQYFEKDGALTRRFQKIIVEEPTLDQMTGIINQSVRPRLEEYHKCIISDEAIEYVIRLSNRYMSDRKFPDKAIDCLDMACAKNSWIEIENGNEILPVVGPYEIAHVVSDQCQIPLEMILWDDNERITKIEDIMHSKIIGQKDCVKSVCRILKNAYSGIRDPRKPIGSFVFGGPSGTGKTYMAEQMAVGVFGKESSLIKLDMTEYSESHSVSKLIGSPPGYVGYSDSETFVDKIRRKPYCIILLDEFEKAHPSVIKLFMQVLSDGTMTSSQGVKVNFKNTVIVMTGNFGFDSKQIASLGFGDDKECDSLNSNKIVEYIKDKYGMEFVNRIDEILAFSNLTDDDLKAIAEIKIQEIVDRLKHRNITVKCTNKAYDLLIKKSASEFGKNASLLNRIISKEIESCLSDVIMGIKEGSATITVDVDDSGKDFSCRKKK